MECVTFHIILIIAFYSDPESGLSSYHFGIGGTRRDLSILSWVPGFPSLDYVKYTYQIPDGKLAWVKIRAINNGKFYVLDALCSGFDAF